MLCFDRVENLLSFLFPMNQCSNPIGVNLSSKLLQFLHYKRTKQQDQQLDIYVDLFMITFQVEGLEGMLTSFISQLDLY